MVSTSTKKQYLTTYLSLIKKVDSNDPSEVFKYIKEAKLKDTTKLSYLNAMIGLKKLDNKLVKGNLKDIVEYRDRLGNEVEIAREKNNLTDKQANAIKKVNMGDINGFLEKLNSNKHKSKKDLENYILLKLMTKYPLRNDLMEIALTRHRKDLKTPVNSLYIPAKKNEKGLLSLKEYKTAKTWGDILLEIDPDIMEDIKKLVRMDNRDYLFVTANNQPLSTSSFSHKLNRLFQQEFDMPITSTTLRKIYLNDKYGGVLKDMKEDARVMGHDLETQQKIYIPN